MKKLVLLFMVMALCFVGCEKKAEAGIVDTIAGITVTFPQETGVVGLWNPWSGAFGGGVAHTYVRGALPGVEFFTIDGDIVLASEISQEKKDMYGPGMKVNFPTLKLPQIIGLNILPNIGVTGLFDMNKTTSIGEIFDSIEPYVYGTLIQYVW